MPAEEIIERYHAELAAGEQIGHGYRHKPNEASSCECGWGVDEDFTYDDWIDHVRGEGAVLDGSDMRTDAQ